MEKHCKSVINRNICDYFFEAQRNCAKPEDIQTVVPTPHHKLIVIYRNKLYFVAVVMNEGKLSKKIFITRTTDFYIFGFFF
jgi:AP-3 complex subunit mu